MRKHFGCLGLASGGEGIARGDDMRFYHRKRYAIGDWIAGGGGNVNARLAAFAALTTFAAFACAGRGLACGAARCLALLARLTAAPGEHSADQCGAKAKLCPDFERAAHKGAFASGGNHVAVMAQLQGIRKRVQAVAALPSPQPAMPALPKQGLPQRNESNNAERNQIRYLITHHSIIHSPRPRPCPL
jgi:hypothetical protein